MASYPSKMNSLSVIVSAIFRPLIIIKDNWIITLMFIDFRLKQP